MIKPGYRKVEFKLPLVVDGKTVHLVCKRIDPDELSDLPDEIKLIIAGLFGKEYRRLPEIKPKPNQGAPGKLAQQAEAIRRGYESQMQARVSMAITSIDVAAELLVRMVVAQEFLDEESGEVVRLPLQLVRAEGDQSEDPNDSPMRVWVESLNPMELAAPLVAAVTEVTPFRS